MLKIFSSILSGFNVISKKKKVLRLSCATFLRYFCNIPEQGGINRSCLRFLAGNKIAGFWREQKRRNSQKFNAKMPKKFCTFRTFLRLWGTLLPKLLNPNSNARLLRKRMQHNLLNRHTGGVRST